MIKGVSTNYKRTVPSVTLEITDDIKIVNICNSSNVWTIRLDHFEIEEEKKVINNADGNN